MDVDLTVLTLYPSKKKMLWMMLTSFAFSVGGMFIIQDGDVLGYACFGFFALCTLVSGLMLMPGANYLAIRPDGFTSCTAFRTIDVNWLDVQEFRVLTVAGTSVVGWIYQPHYQPKAKARKLAAALSGVEESLPANYTVPAQQLMALLDQRRRIALEEGTAVRWAAGGIDLPSRWPAAQAPAKGE